MFPLSLMKALRQDSPRKNSGHGFAVNGSELDLESSWKTWDDVKGEMPLERLGFTIELSNFQSWQVRSPGWKPVCEGLQWPQLEKQAFQDFLQLLEF